jgi:hypothetical protein
MYHKIIPKTLSGGDEYFLDHLLVLSDQNSSSISTGAFVCQGGVGIQQSTYCEDVHCVNTTDSTSLTTGSIITQGGLGVAKTIHSNDLVVEDVTDASSTSTGAVQIKGGLGVTKSIYGNLLNIATQSYLQGLIFGGNYSGLLYYNSQLNPATAVGNIYFGNGTTESTHGGTATFIRSGAYARGAGAILSMGGKSYDFGGGQEIMTFAQISGYQQPNSDNYGGYLGFNVNNNGSLVQAGYFDNNKNLYVNNNLNVTGTTSFGGIVKGPNFFSTGGIQTISSNFATQWLASSLTGQMINRSGDGNVYVDILPTVADMLSNFGALTQMFSILVHNVKTAAIIIQGPGTATNIYSGKVIQARSFTISPNAYVKLTFNIYDTSGDYDVWVEGATDFGNYDMYSNLSLGASAQVMTCAQLLYKYWEFDGPYDTPNPGRVFLPSKANVVHFFPQPVTLMILVRNNNNSLTLLITTNDGDSVLWSWGATGGSPNYSMAANSYIHLTFNVIDGLGNYNVWID